MKVALSMLVALLFASAAAAGTPSYPVRTMKAAGFGTVLGGANRHAVYVWNAERDRKIHCTGACARIWPPLLVPRGVKVPPRLAGVKGRFGTIRRPGGKLQVTYNGRPLYGYVHEGARQVLCDNVDGWFAVRV
jgi:predicted lipoprotein with Yx(FWY)xxD motif